MGRMVSQQCKKVIQDKNFSMVHTYGSIATFLITNEKSTGYIRITVVLCRQKGCDENGSQKTTTNGNTFKRTDNRWGGTVWYMDESGELKRKSFSGITKQNVNKKMTDYIANSESMAKESVESNKTLQSSIQNWRETFKFPSVERTTYDRYECTVLNQISHHQAKDSILSDIPSPPTLLMA